MWHNRTILLAVAGTFLGFVSAARADSLQLKNGNFVQGKYLGGTERAVQFEANGKVRIYDINEILSISFAAASADGGIPSNDDDRTPNSRTGLNSLGENNGTELSVLAGYDRRAPKPLSTRISIKKKQVTTRQSCAGSARVPRSGFADASADLVPKARLSPIAAHPVSPVAPNSSALSD